MAIWGIIAIETQWDLDGDIDIMWNTMTGQIRWTTNEFLGELKGKGPPSKETWGETMRFIVKAKKENFK